MAWLSLDEGDNDPARFLTYLVAALQILQRGQLLPFNAMTGLLSSCWPVLAFACLVFLIRGDNKNRADAGRSAG